MYSLLLHRCCLAALVSKAVTAAAYKALPSTRKPNFIVILTDDQVGRTQARTSSSSSIRRVARVCSWV
jgi:hypothetical protein